MYRGIKFYARKVSARKGAALAGTVIAVSLKAKNGVCSKAFSTGPCGSRHALPLPTWISPDKLEKLFVEVSEETARELHPEFFAYLDKWAANRPGYRASYRIEAAERFRTGRTLLQPVTPRSNAGQGGVEIQVSAHDVAEQFHAMYGA